MLSSKNQNHQKGFATFLITILVLIVMFGIAVSITILILTRQRISRNVIDSTQSYYTAEAGLEDILVRLFKGKNWVDSYSLSIDDASTTIEASDIVGGVRTITSEGNKNNRIRKIKIVYQISSDKISFYYGAQIGDGGMEMGNNARVQGNVFSNGSVIAPTGDGLIDNSIVVARNGNKIEGLVIGEDATVHTCRDSAIGITLTYVSGGSVTNCPAGGTVKSRPNEILPLDLPISQDQIDSWKNAASAGGVLASDYILDLGASGSLGPIQIGTTIQPRNLTITNNARFNITGTIYVTGDIIFSNNAIIELNSDSYSFTGGVIIADGKITIENNVILRGSGETGSYVLILSTNDSLDPASPAIYINNNAEGAVFYTVSGLVFLKNNMIAREITGYKIQIENNAEIQYESGLENAMFSSGTGGSWEVTSWQETE